MADRIPFEEEAVKAYLRAAFQVHAIAVQEIDEEQPGAADAADSLGDTPAGRVLSRTGAATMADCIHKALFGESLLSADSAQEGDVVQ